MRTDLRDGTEDTPHETKSIVDRTRLRVERGGYKRRSRERHSKRRFGRKVYELDFEEAERVRVHTRYTQWGATTANGTEREI